MPPNLYNFGRITFDDQTFRGRLIAGGRDMFGPDYTPTDWEIDRFKYDNMRFTLRKYQYDELQLDEDFETLRTLNAFVQTGGAEWWQVIGKHLVGLRFQTHPNRIVRLYGFVLSEGSQNVTFFIPYLDMQLTNEQVAQRVRNHLRMSVWPELKHLLGYPSLNYNDEDTVRNTIRELGLERYWEPQPGPGGYGVQVTFPYHIIVDVVELSHEQGDAGTGDLVWDMGPDEPGEEPISELF